LIKFKDLQISKEELYNKLGFTVEVDNPVVISAPDVIHLLSAYADKRITIEHLLDWVNTVWFTDFFDYDDVCCDSIASVLNELEELDEDGRELTPEDIGNYIDALKDNREV